jgi:hypothetical protein
MDDGSSPRLSTFNDYGIPREHVSFHCFDEASNDLLALVRIGRANVGSDMVDGESDVKTLVEAWLSHESSGTWPMIVDLLKLMRRLKFLGWVYNKNESGGSSFTITT